MSDNMENIDDPKFLKKLEERIDFIRMSVVLDEDNQMCGVRFKDTNFAVDTAQGAVIATSDPDATPGTIQREAIGLRFDVVQIKKGYYDDLIRYVLNELAKMDYDFENRVDLH
jgi:hypothetical protein